MKGQLKIDQMYAFIVVDDDGTEGIPAVDGGGVMLPLVGADMTRVEQLKGWVRADPMLRGKKITIVKFSQREELDVIDRRN